MAFRMLSLNFLWFTKVPSSGYVDNNSVGMRYVDASRPHGEARL